MADRYRRQTAFAPLGIQGQNKLAQAHVVVCGVGALGSMIAERLCRAGVGKLTLIDRDWVELDNLPRQTLYTEQDAAQSNPKAVACASHLNQINSDIQIVARVSDLHSGNISELFDGADCIADGTDNFETRYLLNDYACQNNVPWVHGGIVGANGQAFTVVPGRTACFRCLMPNPPSADQMQTCDSAGVLGPAVGVIANWQSMEVIKLLTKDRNAIESKLHLFDFWEGRFRSLKVPQVLESDSQPGCACCVQKQFEFLTGKRETHARALCGRNSVQIHATGGEPGRTLDLVAIAERLSTECDVKSNPFFLKFDLDDLRWTVFRDGRVILTGTEDVELARKLFSRRIGN